MTMVVQSFVSTSMDKKGRRVYEKISQEMQGETYLANIFRKISKACIITSLESGEIIFANEAAEKFAGMKLKNAIGKTTLEIGFISAKARQEMTTLLRENGSCDNFVLKLSEGDSDSKTVLLSASLFEDEGQRYIASFFSDFTHHAHLYDVVETSNDGLIKALTLIEGVQTAIEIFKKTVADVLSDNDMIPLDIALERAKKAAEILYGIADKIAIAKAREETRRLKEQQVIEEVSHENQHSVPDDNQN